ncbi:type II toxin-antitoxin system VapC family toxin [Salinarimonas rosea]|uniref:type II toxin-antitoxin system VapC family toxin n=1 Tax=Salinarimonas rosea TaxID=552063 RepID=UPI0003FC5FB5|nr:type II toxin-antitoxin system VapC family toxin [Salinarimonas rosea]
MIVLDASMALSWFFEDEQTPAGRAIMDHAIERGAIVPSLWKLEVANVLRMSVRRGRCTMAFADQAIADLVELEIEIDAETADHAWNATRTLAHDHGLTVYDAAYLEVALRRRLPLATCDKRLDAAARGLGLRVLGT